MRTKSKDSKFTVDLEKISWTTNDFLKKPARSLSYIFILFIFLFFAILITYMSLTKTSITIDAESEVITLAPLLKQSAESDISVEQLVVRNGEKVKKGQAMILGSDRILTEDYLRFNEQLDVINDWIEKLRENKCSGVCLKSMREESIDVFRYLKQDFFKVLVKKIRETLFNLASMKTRKTIDLDKLQLLLADLSESISIIQANQVIYAPATGTVLIPSSITSGSYIKKGAVIFEIIPENHDVAIRAFIQNKDISKLKVGMEAKISIDAYPPRTYGLLNGIISTIGVTKSTLIDKLNYYEVEILLDKQYFEAKGLKKKLLIGMRGKSFIISGHTNLLRRYFGKFIGFD